MKLATIIIITLNLFSVVAFAEVKTSSTVEPNTKAAKPSTVGHDIILDLHLPSEPMHLKENLEKLLNLYSTKNYEEVKKESRSSLEEFRFNGELMLILAATYLSENNYPVAKFFLDYAANFSNQQNILIKKALVEKLKENKDKSVSTSFSSEESDYMKLAYAKGIPSFIEKDFIKKYHKFHDYTMLNWDALYTNFTAARYVAENQIEGDVVECGVFEGGSIFLLAESLKLFGADNRKIYLYDTFEGMSKPEEDVTTSDNSKASDLYFKNMGQGSSAKFNKILNEVDYPKNNIIIVKGMVEDTLPKTMPTKISILRLDTDWYNSTKHELVHLYPLVVKGGIIIIDDYHFWKGSKKALDEYVSIHKLPLYFHTDIIQGSIVAVKP